MLVFAWLRVRSALSSYFARKRFEQATQAVRRRSATKSEATTFGVLCVISLVAGFGFALGAALAPERGLQVYGLVLAFAFFFDFTLFFLRFGHFQSILFDIDHIERLRRIAREGPSAGQFLKMRWKGQRPANDF